MTARYWVSVCEFSGFMAATLAAKRLEERGIPCKIKGVGVYPRYLWVPPDRASEAKAILATDEVPEDELTKEAISYPPPDDA